MKYVDTVINVINFLNFIEFVNVIDVIEVINLIDVKHFFQIKDLDEERRKREHDTAQGDDITYCLEKDRTNLKQVRILQTLYFHFCFKCFINITVNNNVS